jgi:hypothetical protein
MLQTSNQQQVFQQTQQTVRKDSSSTSNSAIPKCPVQTKIEKAAKHAYKAALSQKEAIEAVQ